MNAEASWRYAFVFSFMVGDSKVPRISTITTLKFSQSILIFKILSRKRVIYRELKKQRRRRCVYVSKASSSLFVDYINRKKERMAERIQESMEGVTKGYIGDLVWKFFPSLRQGRSQVQRNIFLINTRAPNVKPPSNAFCSRLPRISAHVMISPHPRLSVHPLDRNIKKPPISNKRPPSFLNFFNSLTPKISLVILLVVSHAVLVMLVWRIWYWIHFYSPYWYFFVMQGDILSWSLRGVQGLIAGIQGKPVFIAL